MSGRFKCSLPKCSEAFDQQTERDFHETFQHCERCAEPLDRPGARSYGKVCKFCVAETAHSENEGTLWH